MASQWEREQRRLRDEAEFEERELLTEERNSELQEQIEALDSTLASGVQLAPTLDYASRRKAVSDPSSLPGPRSEPEPVLDDYLPKEPTLLGRALPGWERRYAARREEALIAFKQAHYHWEEWTRRVNAEHAALVADAERRSAAAIAENDLLDKHQAESKSGTQRSVEDYVDWALSSSSYPYEVRHILRYLPSRKELLLQVLFPAADDVIPSVAKWTHIKVRKSVEAKDRTVSDRNKRYKDLIAEITIRSLYECFHIDAIGHIERISFKGIVEGVSPVTGRLVTPPVISLRVERNIFLDREFERVDAVKLLQSLRANISNEPTELKPVPLVVEFDPTDPRLIDEEDVLSTLDDRDNLIDLTAPNFELLITNLFNRMGYEAYPTVRSKDGGVDCIAYYSDPVGVNKCVIQAKKWTVPVGVDAVRDLAGAMDHERASKGILVTTSRVAPAGWKFVEDKPMQIIEGDALLGLIEQYTDLRVTIVFPPK
jgi:restriction system protein